MLSRDSKGIGFLKNNNNKNVIILDSLSLNEILNDDKPERKFKQIIFRNVSNLAEINPFEPNGCVTDELSIFLGREKQISEILNNKVSLICGGRRIGKSSLLTKVEHELKNEYLVVKYSVGAPVDEAKRKKQDLDSFIASKILLRLKDNLPEGFESNTSKSNDPLGELEELIYNITKENLKVAILLDEFDVYLENADLIDHKSSELLRILREKANDHVGKYSWSLLVLQIYIIILHLIRSLIRVHLNILAI